MIESTYSDCASCGRRCLTVGMHDIRGVLLCQSCVFAGHGQDVADEQADEADYECGQWEQEQGP